MPHGEEGHGEPGAEEHDEVGRQLEPVVDAEGQVIPWSREAVPSPPGVERQDLIGFLKNIDLKYLFKSSHLATEVEKPLAAAAVVVARRANILDTVETLKRKIIM